MVLKELVNQLAIFSLVSVNVNLDERELIAKHWNLQKYWPVLYVDWAVRLCELIVVA